MICCFFLDTNAQIRSPAGCLSSDVLALGSLDAGNKSNDLRRMCRLLFSQSFWREREREREKEREREREKERGRENTIEIVRAAVTALFFFREREKESTGSIILIYIKKKYLVLNAGVLYIFTQDLNPRKSAGFKHPPLGSERPPLQALRKPPRAASDGKETRVRETYIQEWF